MFLVKLASYPDEATVKYARGEMVFIECDLLSIYRGQQVKSTWCSGCSTQ